MCSVFFSFCLLLFPQILQSKEILLDIRAQVKGQTLTSRQVHIHHILTEALGDKGDFLSKPDPTDSLIAEWLLFYEARSFYPSPLSQKVLNERLQQVKKKLKTRKDWKKWGVTGAELRQKLLRHMEAQRMYQFKKKAFFFSASHSKSPGLASDPLSSKEVQGGQGSPKSIEKRWSQHISQWFEALESKYAIEKHLRPLENRGSKKD